jgi:hypothetical protein
LRGLLDADFFGDAYASPPLISVRLHNTVQDTVFRNTTEDFEQSPLIPLERLSCHHCLPIHYVAGVSLMSLEGMRDLLKGSLGRSLGALRDEDRLAAAWPVACGKAMAEHGTVVGYADGVVRVEVEDGAWLRQLVSMRGQLAGEMARIAGVGVSEIHFERKRNDRR